jgi:type I restriction enzyme S subunit
MVLKMRKMKDSGIEWIGEIPEGWEVSKLKYLGRYVNGYPFKPDDWGDEGKPIIRIQDLTGSNDSPNYYDGDIDAKYHIKNGDILVSWAATLDAFIWNKGDGLLNQHIFKAIPQEEKITSYFFFWMIKEAMQNMNNDNKHGIFMQHVTLDVFNNFSVPLPPLSEQKRIATYLFQKISEADIMLDDTLSSITGYKKLKQAVITQAVTKGVRGEREMKDSGVEWIGEIPVEWRKTQLRHCATIKSGITLGKSYSKDTVLIERPYLRVANVQGGYVDLNDLATIEVTPDEDLKYRLHSGDVLMTEGGDRDKLGRGCVWHGEIEPCLHQNHVFAVQTNETILLPEFLEYLTASDVGRSYFDVTAIKTTNLACTSSSKVLAFTIPLPPIEEQIEIVSFIKKRSLELNKLIMKKELLVQELESYKKSLIYEVVTGKREV